MMILNIVNIILFWKLIFIDEGYENWSKIHYISNKFINIFSVSFSFHVQRLLYSRFLGYDIFACKLKNYSMFWIIINVMSIIWIIWVDFLTIIGDIVGLILIPWTT